MKLYKHNNPYTDNYCATFKKDLKALYEMYDNELHYLKEENDPNEIYAHRRKLVHFESSGFTHRDKCNITFTMNPNNSRIVVYTTLGDWANMVVVKTYSCHLHHRRVFVKTTSMNRSIIVEPKSKRYMVLKIGSIHY